MNIVLKKLKDLSSDCCVTIILNTHRTLPDNEKDRILLKNLVKEAETRLPNECKSKSSDIIIDKLNTLANSIDHRRNLESLVLFVNADVAEYTRLPVPVQDRVVIDKTFATRDLIRTLNKEKGYYVMVLSRDKARLIEAHNDKVVEEMENETFPIENTTQYPTERAEAAMGSRQTSLMQEFFNRVDKQLIEVIKENPLSVLICSDEPNYHHYLKVADRKEIIMGHLNGSRTDDEAHHIIDDAWPVVKDVRDRKNKQRLQELADAVNAGKFVTDFNDIWRAVNNGRGDTLFVKRGYFQSARLVDNTLELIPDGQTGSPDVIDDVIDEMIEINLQYGGDSVFLSEEDLKKYQGLVLTTRY